MAREEESKLSRKPWPDDVREAILIKSRRICALCFHFSSDSGVKIRGQIAHVDRDSTNSELENGAYLCKNHHDEYDMKSNQSQRLNPGELKQARANLYEFVESGGPSLNRTRPSRPKHSRPRAVSLAVYERRLPIYTATIAFIRYIVGDLKPEYSEIIKFGRATEEALFLFDEQIAQYLNELSGRAVRLHAVVKMRQAAITYNRETGNLESWLTEETSLATWFTEQYDVTRRLLMSFLRLSD